MFFFFFVILFTADEIRVCDLINRMSYSNIYGFLWRNGLFI